MRRPSYALPKASSSWIEVAAAEAAIGGEIYMKGRARMYGVGSFFLRGSWLSFSL